MAEYRIKSGLSTRVVQLTSGEKVRVSREALDKAVRQVDSGFIPMSVEHLSYLPPRGRLTRAEVVTDSDGESELLIYGQDLTFLHAGDLSLKPAVTETGQPSMSPDTVTISAEPRNYSRDSWGEIVADSPMPVKEAVAWSDLPPLIWTLSIPVTWSAVKFTGSFFERLGSVAADEFVAWLKRAAKAAKNPERETLVEIRFDLENGGLAILGYAPLEAASEDSVAALRAALDQIGLLAEFAGSVAAGQQPVELRRCSFIWDFDKWRLAWWATDDVVCVTPWFRQNYPDPQRFLGRPLFEADKDDGNDLGQSDIQE
jgi:hypothetical protein